MEEDKDMQNENKDTTDEDKIETAEFDGGVVTMSAQGMQYESKDNEIETTEYVWKTNRKGLCSRLAERINEKLNQAVQGLEYDSFSDPVVLYFSCHVLAKHFYNQLKSHGWDATIDDDDVVQVDIVSSINQLDKNDDDIGDSGFFADEVLSLK